MRLLPAFASSGAFLPLSNGHAPLHLLRGVFDFHSFAGARVVFVDPECDPITAVYGYNIHAVCDRCGRDVHKFYRAYGLVRCERCVRVCERDCAHDLREGGYNK